MVESYVHLLPSHPKCRIGNTCVPETMSSHLCRSRTGVIFRRTFPHKGNINWFICHPFLQSTPGSGEVTGNMVMDLRCSLSNYNAQDFLGWVNTAKLLYNQPIRQSYPKWMNVQSNHDDRTSLSWLNFWEMNWFSLYSKLWNSRKGSYNGSFR